MNWKCVVSGWICATAVLLAFVLPSRAQAQNGEDQTMARASFAQDETLDTNPSFWVSVKGGISAFPLTTQSPALPHVLKPLVRAEFGYLISPDLGLGVELSGIIDSSANYRLLSGMLLGRAGAYRGDIFSIWFAWGVGLGNAPPILASDLVVTEDVALMAEMGLQFRWVVVDNLLSLGIDIVDQNVVVVSAAAAVELAF